MTFNAYMHERNIYRNQPDFTQIALDFPEFRKYAIPDAKCQKVRVDFTNAEALRTLTKILLKKDFNLDIVIPEGFLIPTVPQRLNYILWLEDLISDIDPAKRKECICGIDIGTGACAIFSILGAQKNGWNFVASESSDDAILWAKKNVEKNNLCNKITVTKVNQGSSLGEILSLNQECYDFCMCNPPFFENIEDIRKKHRHSNETIADVAQKDEIFVKGGEYEFVKNILQDSLIYKDRICLFTSMFGKKKSFLQILKDIKEIKDVKFSTTEFCQGNTIRWGIVWTYNDSIQFEQEVKKRIKPKKAKPPLEYQIPITESKSFNLKTLVTQAKEYLNILQINLTITRSSDNFTEILLKSDKNTWTHQRRKRREVERQRKHSCNVEQNSVSVSSSKSIQDIDNVHNCKESCFLPEKHNIDLIDNTKNEEVTKECNVIAQMGNLESQGGSISNEVSSSNISVKLESRDNSLVCGTNDIECTKDCDMLQNNKRKINHSFEEPSACKKAKSDASAETKILSKNSISPENSKSISSFKIEKCMESCSSNSGSISVKLEIKEEKKDSNCDIGLASVLNQKDPSSSSPLNSSSKTSSENGKIHPISVTDDKVGEKHSESSFDDSVKTQDIEPEGSVLYSHLQFIKGKSKVYVKMNCPLSADRNTMYQVFQLLKNKVN